MLNNAELYFHRHHHIGDPHVHHCSEEDMRSDGIWKGVSIAAIYLIGMIFCVLPIALRSRFSRSARYTQYLGMANAFAAGTFLSLGLIHLLPEGEERLAEYYGVEANTKYRFCYVMCAIGYACILMLERIVFTTPTCAHHMHRKVHMEDALHAGKFSGRDVGDLSATLLPLSAADASSPLPAGLTDPSPDTVHTLASDPVDAHNAILHIDEGCAQGGLQPCDDEDSHIILRNRERIVAAVVNKVASAEQCAACEFERRASPLTTALHQLADDAQLEATPAKTATPRELPAGRLTQESLSALSSSYRHGRSLTSSLALDASSDQVNDEKGYVNQLSKADQSMCPSVVSAVGLHELNKAPHAPRHTVQPYILMAALSAHGMSEGLALGVERGTRNIMLLFLAILAHKWAEGLALGISFSRTTIGTNRVLGLLMAFALSTPVGIGIGWLAQAILPGCAEGYFLGFSSGSFLYIGASEVVVEEFIQGRRQWGKFLSFLGGVALIYLISIFLEC